MLHRKLSDTERWQAIGLIKAQEGWRKFELFYNELDMRF